MESGTVSRYHVASRTYERRARGREVRHESRSTSHMRRSPRGRAVRAQGWKFGQRVPDRSAHPFCGARKPMYEAVGPRGRPKVVQPPTRWMRTGVSWRT
jgi:hypothetical protein